MHYRSVTKTYRQGMLTWLTRLCLVSIWASIFASFLSHSLLHPTLVRAADTGFVTTTTTSAVTPLAGDLNGFETTYGTANPINTTTNNSAGLGDTNSGTNNLVDGCTVTFQPEDDQHDFFSFGFSIPANSTINGLELQTDGRFDSSTNTNKFCLYLSWDGGITWTSPKDSGDINNADVTTTYGGAADTWGRTWSATEFSNANFKVRLMVDVYASNARDAYLDYLALKIYYTPPTTTLGDGTDPSNATLAPGGSITDLDAFTLQASSGTDTVTGATVTLANGTAGGLSEVRLTSNDGSTTYCTATNPASDTVTLSSCTLPVTTSSTQFKVRITPKSHANMAAPPGSTYSVTGTVTSLTMTNSLAGTDTDSATVTIDNTSPGEITGTGGSAGDQQVSLSWTNPGDSDFSQAIVLRRAGTAVGDTPTEGSSYSVGNTIGSSTVACVTASTSCSDTGLTNGTTYHYKIYTKDSNGNYSSTGVVPTGSPFTPILISISLTTDGIVDFGYLALGSSRDTTAAGTNDVQTVRVDSGPADLDIKSSTFTQGANTWTLAATNGANQTKWEFSPDGSSWTTFALADTLYSLGTNVAAAQTKNIYLKITMPTSSDSLSQYSTTVTVVASTP